MGVEHAVFLRIDTADGSPCLEDAARELVVSTLLQEREKGWFELLGFVVLPNEVQLLFIPHKIAVAALIDELEKTVFPAVSQAESVPKTVFDTDFYREKIDCSEDIKHRLKWMLQTPVRARLARMSESYPYSSANVRYQNILSLDKTLM